MVNRVCWPGVAATLGLRDDTDPGSRAIYVQCETFSSSSIATNPTYVMLLDCDREGNPDVPLSDASLGTAGSDRRSAAGDSRNRSEGAIPGLTAPLGSQTGGGIGIRTLARLFAL